MVLFLSFCTEGSLPLKHTHTHLRAHTNKSNVGNKLKKTLRAGIYKVLYFAVNPTPSCQVF